MNARPSPEVAASYAHCLGVARARARNFYYAFLTLPAPRRAAIAAIYAYCRLLDDIADGDLPVAEKEKAIARVEEALEKALRGEATGPIFPALADAVRRFGISVDRLADVARGVRQDLVVTRYASFRELEGYCRLVASAVGLACLDVFEPRERGPADEAASDLGIAMQLTNVLRDIREDAARGRIYLPGEDLDRFGVAEEDLLRGAPGPGFARLVAFEADRAAAYYRRAVRLFAYLPRRSRPCPMVLYGVYGRLLEALRRRPDELLDRRISLSKPLKAGIALRYYLLGIAGRPPA